MTTKGLELEIALLKEEIAKQAKEIAELKKREPVIINLPANSICPMQHYPVYPSSPQLILHHFHLTLQDAPPPPLV